MYPSLLLLMTSSLNNNKNNCLKFIFYHYFHSYSAVSLLHSSLSNHQHRSSHKLSTHRFWLMEFLFFFIILFLILPLSKLERVPSQQQSTNSATVSAIVNKINNKNNHLAYYNSIISHLLRFNLGIGGGSSALYSSLISPSSSSSSLLSTYFISRAINSSYHHNHHGFSLSNLGGTFLTKTITNNNNNNPEQSSYSGTTTSFRLKKSFDKFHDNIVPFLLNKNDNNNSNNDLIMFNDSFLRPLMITTNKVMNTSFLEYLLNSDNKQKLSRKLHHLLLTILIQSNNNVNNSNNNNDSSNGNLALTDESNELISNNNKNFAKALRKSMKSNNNHHQKRNKKNLSNGGSNSISSSSVGSLANVISRCYEPYGCFRITEPFRTIYRPINLLPEPPGAIKVAFYLRTRSNPTISERLVYNENSDYLISKYFRPDSNLKLIIHGYLESSDEYWINEMSLALLNRADLNIICVDWMLGASPPYSQAVANTRLVGTIIAHFIQIVQKSHPNRFQNENIHIIGHSLGAHIAGYAGELLNDLGQITGLDPAEPYFQYTDPVVRLDPKDAKFVDVIHSDVASIVTGGFGMSQPCGHVDFYPNGGVEQPGCKQTSIKNVVDYINKEKNLFDGIRRFIGCNHARSFLIYIEAINSECPFMAFPCETYDEFINGQCKSTLIDHSYHHCFASTETTSSILTTVGDDAVDDGIVLDRSVTKNVINITCPIRLGLDSIHDYQTYHQQQQQQHKQNKTIVTITNTASDTTLTASKLLYFLQTNDKHPYCQYHYNVKLVFHFQRSFPTTTSGSSVVTNTASNSRTIPWKLGNYYEWPFNGKLQLTVVGTRNRIQAETLLKQEYFKEQERSSSSSSGSGSYSKFEDHSSSSTFSGEYNILISGGDLGKLLRVELDWRNSGQIQRSLATMQNKKFKKLLSQLSASSSSIELNSLNSISTLQNFLNEIQRSLNVNQSHHHYHPFSTFKSRAGLIIPSMVTNSINNNIDKNFDTNQNEIISSLLLKQQQQPASSELLNPILRAVFIQKLETNSKTLFCVNEKEIQEMFIQSWKKHQSKSYTLLETNNSKINNISTTTTKSIDFIVSTICKYQ